MSAQPLKVGDCVMVGTLRVTGTVTGFTTKPIPGVQVRLHRIVNGLQICTASYNECEVIARSEPKP